MSINLVKIFQNALHILPLLLALGGKLNLNAMAKSKLKTMTFTRTDVAFNGNYLENHTLEINPDGSTLNIILNVARNFEYDPWVEVSIAIRQDKQQQNGGRSGGRRKRQQQTATNKPTYRNLFTYDINVCNILGKPASDRMNLMQLWLNNFLKYGTMPRSCPILKGNYYWRGLKIDRASLPSFLLNGFYRSYVRTYFRFTSKPRIYVANLSIFFNIH